MDDVLDERLLNIIGEVSLSGDPQILEKKLEFDFQGPSTSKDDIVIVHCDKDENSIVLDKSNIKLNESMYVAK